MDKNPNAIVFKLSTKHMWPRSLRLPPPPIFSKQYPISTYFFLYSMQVRIKCNLLNGVLHLLVYLGFPEFCFKIFLVGALACLTHATSLICIVFTFTSFQSLYPILYFHRHLPLWYRRALRKASCSPQSVCSDFSKLNHCFLLISFTKSN